MPYNASSMYSGYAAGDPFLGGLIKGVGKFIGGAAKVVSRVVPGPVGAIAGVVGGLAGGRAAGVPAPPAGFQLPQVTGIGVSLPGGYGASAQIAPRGGMARPVDGALPPRGHRLNKSRYYSFTENRVIEPYTRYVRIRRTNPGNARALRRSLRRAEGFVGLVSRTRKVTRRLKKI